MSDSDKFAGKAKEAAGKATGDDELKDEGKTQHAKGEFEEKVDDAKASVKGAVDSVKDKFSK